MERSTYRQWKRNRGKFHLKKSSYRSTSKTYKNRRNEFETNQLFNSMLFWFFGGLILTIVGEILIYSYLPSIVFNTVVLFLIFLTGVFYVIIPDVFTELHWTSGLFFGNAIIGGIVLPFQNRLYNCESKPIWYWGVSVVLSSIIVIWLLVTRLTGWREKRIIEKMLAIVVRTFFLVIIAECIFNTINCTYDGSKAEYSEAQVVNKKEHTTTGKTRVTHFYVTVNKTGSQCCRKYEITGNVYKKIKIGDQIRLEIHKGLFGVKWVQLRSQKEISLL